MYEDTRCPLKCGTNHLDNQENLLVCRALKYVVEDRSISYSDFFKDVHLQKRAAETYIKLIKKRKDLISTAAQSQFT